MTSVGILREHQEVVLGAEAEQVWRVPSGPNGKMSIDRYWLPEWLQQTSEECSYDPVCLPGVGVYTDMTPVVKVFVLAKHIFIKVRSTVTEWCSQSYSTRILHSDL